MRTLRFSLPLLVVLTASLGLLSGCSSTPRQADGSGANVADGTYPYGGAGTSGYDSGAAGAYGDRPWEDPGSPLHTRTIYFDYDSSAIQQKYVPVVRTHASYLGSHPDVRITIEGHTDERGTQEYNLALGEQRAEAVRQFMLSEGVRPDQIATLSYGEERPVDPAHDESAWRVNRRAVIQY